MDMIWEQSTSVRGASGANDALKRRELRADQYSCQYLQSGAIGAMSWIERLSPMRT